MKTYVIFSSREPLLIVTRRSIRNSKVIDHLRRIGCTKFISREVPLDDVRRQYGNRFKVIERGLQEGSDVRVLDFDGEQVLQSVPFSQYGRAFRCESVSAPASSRRTNGPIHRGTEPENLWRVRAWS